MKSYLISLLLLLTTASQGWSQMWTNIQNLQVSFTIKNAGINVEGRFNEVTANASIDEQNFSRSSLSGVVQVKSVSTDNTTRDGHIRDKSEFFNAQKFPTITMKSLKVGSTQVGGSYKVEWLITIKGVSKRVTSDVLVHPNGNTLLVVTVFKLNRRDWNIGSKSLIMSDDVLVTLNGTLTR